MSGTVLAKRGGGKLRGLMPPTGAMSRRKWKRSSSWGTVRPPEKKYATKRPTHPNKTKQKKPKKKKKHQEKKKNRQQPTSPKPPKKKKKKTQNNQHTVAYCLHHAFERNELKEQTPTIRARVGRTTAAKDDHDTPAVSGVGANSSYTGKNSKADWRGWVIGILSDSKRVRKFAGKWRILSTVCWRLEHGEVLPFREFASPSVLKLLQQSKGTWLKKERGMCRENVEVKPRVVIWGKSLKKTANVT